MNYSTHYIQQELPTITDRRETAIQTLGAHLKRTVWTSSETLSALQNCFCAYVLANQPAVEFVTVAQAIAHSDQTMSLPDFLNSLANLERKAITLSSSPAELDPRLLPCLHIPVRRGRRQVENAKLVLSANDTVNGREYTVFRGSDGTFEDLSEAQVRNELRGEVFVFQDTKDAVTKGSESEQADMGYRWFRATLPRFAHGFWQIIAVSTTLSLVSLGTPLFIMLVYDRVIAPHNTEPLAYLAVGVGMAILMEWVLKTLRTVSISWLTGRLDYVVGTAIFERLIQLSPQMIERAYVSAQIARIRTFESIRDFFNSPVFMSLIDMPTILVSLVAITWLGGWLAMVPAVIGLLYVALFLFLRMRVQYAIQRAARATSATQRFSLETFEKLEGIRAAGLGARWLDKFKDLSGRENVALLRLNIDGFLGETLAHALTVLSAMATLAVGIHLIWQNQLTTGALVASMILTWRILSPFNGLCTVIPRFEQMRNSVIQIDNLMEVPIENEANEITMRVASNGGQLHFNNVTLRYTREGGPIMLGLNADIQRGELVIITGASGSGKSSMLKLALGLYAPVTGTIHLDGIDIRQIQPHSLRPSICYVPQASELLPGTVAESLRFANAFASDEELWAALREAGAEAAVRALPDGLQTDLSDVEVLEINPALPFRLGLARALLHPSRLILIDEQPSFVLSAGMQADIKRLVENSRGQRTILLVSHRDDFADMADRVVHLRRGKTPIIRTRKTSQLNGMENAA